MLNIIPAERICVSLGECPAEIRRAVLDTNPLVELRLDLLNLDAEVEQLVKSRAKIVLAYRPKPAETPAQMENRCSVLSRGIAAGAAFIDIELDSSPEYRQALVEAARGADCKVMISSHVGRSTSPVLFDLIEQCFAAGAHLAKIACEVTTAAEVAGVLSLYQSRRPIIAVGTGAAGWMTRIVAPFLGAPFVFAYPDGGAPTSTGQLSYSEMLDELERLSGLGRDDLDEK